MFQSTHLSIRQHTTRGRQSLRQGSRTHLEHVIDSASFVQECDRLQQSLAILGTPEGELFDIAKDGDDLSIQD